MPLQGKKILLVIAGGIAAYKSLDLIRRLRERGAKVRVIMTRAAQEFVTPLAVGAVAGERPFTELFDLSAEFDIGHIRLAREPDLVVVAPATADLMAKMVHGRADDLASTVLLATDRRILLAPAMNPAMWSNSATRRNVERLQADGIAFVGPEAGEMAESGERGVGRMSEPLSIVAAIEKNLFELPARDALSGKRILVTSGPTREPIDPVRYISNHSSGKQGHALARMAAQAGAEVVLVSGPVSLPDPSGVKTIHVETAEQMLNASEGALPADAAIFAAAVADWRVATESAQKMKKQEGKLPSLSFAENPDILATVSRHSNLRPRLVIGFAAETENLIDNARAKLLKKGCDWIVANDVSTGTDTFGGASNEVHIVSATGVESWPMQSKDAVAAGLVRKIAAALGGAR
ncbi:MAG: bifunctional phosphopantothenoylcysteine decarboxylase/phosphopantothenate--cysteine ligase CoaBC [Rhizobiales bacterium]|nr:bifunctional phosphopantothenoylcysteine decarboxylase/phosphopantothenate--cysteine ligase CoaBC [Hyphomicrobiales bacterium]